MNGASPQRSLNQPTLIVQAGQIVRVQPAQTKQTKQRNPNLETATFST
jgi:hypothetical protein